MTLLFLASLAGAHSMIDSLGELVQLLSQDIGVAEICARVGPVMKNEPAPEALDLRPRLKGIKDASITRYEKGEPLALELVFMAAARPTLGALRDRFGTWKEMPIRFEQPRFVTFASPPGQHWRVLLIAHLEAKVFDIHDTDKPVAITLRRDPVKP